MTYAIVQKELIVPDVEQLKRAFSVSPLLRGIDAQTAARDAYGILLRGQESEHAHKLQEALLREKVETELVEESALPIIPPGHVIRQVDYHPDHLALLDPLQRSAEVPWRDVVFIAAGYVRTRDVRRHRGALDEPASHPGGIMQDMMGGASAREEERFHLMLEIFLNDGGTRYSLPGDEFVFDHLGSRKAEDTPLNFVALVKGLVERTPHAGLNRGACLAIQEPPELFPYPSKSAFNEEIVWMLWRIAKMRKHRA